MSEYEYRLPDVGEGLSEAEIIAWHVSVGSEVVPDQVLAEVETDKSVVEVPSPVTGTIVSLSGSPGDVIDVGAIFTVIAVAESGEPRPIVSDSDPYADMGAADNAAQVEVTDNARSEAPSVESVTHSATKRILASPATRKLALEHGIDLASVRASGPGGRVTRDDVEQHRVSEMSAPSERLPSPANGEPAGSNSESPHTAGENVAKTIPLRGLRRQIAKNMVQSWTSVPHITDFRQVDATGLVSARRSVNDHLAAQGRGEKITYLPFLVRAVSIALAGSPSFNASLDMEKEEIAYFDARNIGLAVATDDGLFVPVLKDSQAMSLVTIGREAEKLAARARDRSITRDEMSGGTFTITNFGSYGGWLGTPIIRPPESAIAGFGKIEDQVVAEGGVPVVKPILPLAVSADHRLIDGSDMGVFLRTLTDLLEDPVRMMAEDF